MSKTKIVYKDYAIGAENPTAYGAAFHPYSDLDQVPIGVSVDPMATTEENYWVLDGTHKLYDGQTLGFLSDSISDANCAFPQNSIPAISLEYDEQVTSLGISFTFDVECGTYPTEIFVTWYQSGSTLYSGTYYPTSPTWYLQETVEHFDTLSVSFRKMNLPYTRLRVDQILLGTDREFTMDEIRDAKITMSTSLISAELPICRLTWTLDSQKDIDYIFQYKQPMEVYNDNRLIGVFYISVATRLTQDIYRIECEDALGILDTMPFEGYNTITGTGAKSLITAIINDVFPYVYDSITTVNLKGLILAGTIRTALQQVCFAWGAMCTTDGHDSLRFFRPPSSGSVLTKDTVYTGGQVDTDAIVTRVDVTEHTYTSSASGLVEVLGQRYDDAKTIYSVANPNVLASDRNNVKEVKEATLLKGRADTTAQGVYDYYERRNKAKAKIVWNGERLGDYVTIPNAWGGSTSGNIESIDMVLSNTVAATITVR